GFQLADEIRAGRIMVRPGVQRFTATGVRFTDGTEQQFDDVILATGFRPALAPVEHLVRCDSRGFALRTDRVRSADQRGLYFVGQDRKSTRLNSSHVKISYAVFCLKKKITVRKRT